MMLKVIFLQVLPVRGQGLVMKKVVGQVVAYVSEDTAREDRRCNVPIPVEDCVCKLPKWCRQREEHRWWHDESEPVHRKIVMNAMKKKVECESNAVIRKELVKMK